MRCQHRGSAAFGKWDVCLFVFLLYLAYLVLIHPVDILLQSAEGPPIMHEAPLSSSLLSFTPHAFICLHVPLVCALSFLSLLPLPSCRYLWCGAVLCVSDLQLLALTTCQVFIVILFVVCLCSFFIFSLPGTLTGPSRWLLSQSLVLPEVFFFCSPLCSSACS